MTEADEDGMGPWIGWNCPECSDVRVIVERAPIEDGHDYVNLTCKHCGWEREYTRALPWGNERGERHE